MPDDDQQQEAHQQQPDGSSLALEDRLVPAERN